MKNVSLYLSNVSEITSNSLIAAIQNVILKVAKIETTVFVPSVPVTRGISVILHDFNLRPFKAFALMEAIRLAVFVVFGGKMSNKDIHVTMHGSLSTDL